MKVSLLFFCRNSTFAFTLDLRYDIIDLSNNLTGESSIVKKFSLSDDQLVKKIYDHLKSFDKFDNLSIDVEEKELAVINYAIKIGDELILSEIFPHRDGILGITGAIELQIEYLSWQVKFFEDVDQLLGSELFVKSYKTCIAEYALGETVLDGVKYEFSLSYDSLQQCHIEIRFDHVIDGLRHESRISTEDWFDYTDLEQTWFKFIKILNQIKEN